MLKNNLETIEKDLNACSNMKRQDLFKSCVNEKLKTTLDNYLHIIEVNSDYLLTRNSMKVLKALTKQQKQEDKKALESGK